MKRYIIAALVVIACSAGGIRADDTEIYGVINNTSVAPNVLIIFDTSGSMADLIPGDPYDPATTYSGSYSTNAVYERYWDGHDYQWLLFTGDVNNLKCAAIKSNLLTEGFATGKITASTFTCSGTKRWLRLGNYCNYDASGIGQAKRKIDVAKEILSDLITNTDGVRFGMMKYNYNDTDATSGGRLLAPCSADKAPLLAAVASASPSGWTPLAETLAEAGLYFAGKPSWFNTSGFPSGTYTGGHYVSPMQYRCQKNYVILMTDGLPTKDRHPKLYSASYINGSDLIGDQDGDHSAPCAGGAYDNGVYKNFDTHEYWYRDDDGNCRYHPDEGSDYLDDVAKYLYSNDCNPTMGAGTSFAKQNIVTYTIGFALEDATKLLYRTAVNGGGEYFTAKNYSALKEAFKQIMSAIVEKNSCFVAPVVPVSRMNRTYAGNKIYLGFFKPQQEGNWYGNIKRYKLEDDGAIKDSKGQVATNSEGLIKDEARSWWTSLGDDGPAVEKGGAAERLEILIGQNARTIYTYTGSQALLTHASNAFITGNTAITNLMLGNPTDRDKLFDIVRKDSFGDVIHSEPAVVFYSNGADGQPDTADDDVKIFVGTNDGQLHCIDDATGNEVWSFVPPDQLGRLLLLSDNAPDHEYFVDGSPTVYYGSNQKILVIGSRRGGKSYTALDITNYNAPRYLYSIGPDVLGPTPTSYEHLGQSWSRPEKVTIATSSVPTISGCGVDITVTSADVFLFAGGYDNENQDLEAPSASDGFGRAVFAANMATGALINNLKFSPATHSSLGLTHSIVDVAGFDHDGDGIISRIYFGDLGGNIFALKDDQVQTFTVSGCPAITKNVVDGVWSGMKLFQAPESNGRKLKILYAPDAVAEKYPPSTHGEYIYFGTGDREDPGNTAVTNRFYAVKNDWTATSPLTESNLVDVTDDLIQLGTAEQQQAVRESLELKKGWYIRLGNQGEKVVSSPRVYAGVVYFTTYTPTTTGGPADPDPCAASTASGVARLYALNYKNGASVTNFNASGETDTLGNPLNGLGKLDRSLIVGTAIPSAPVIAILPGGARIFIGVEGGLVSLPAVSSQDMIRYYWNQIF